MAISSTIKTSALNAQKDTIKENYFSDWIKTQQGYQLGNNGKIPTVNNITLNPENAGMRLLNDKWYGTTAQYQKALEGITPLTKLRDYFATEDIGYMGKAPSINGYQVDPEKLGMQLINGNWYGTTAQLAELKKQIPEQQKVAQPTSTIQDNPFNNPYSDQLKALSESILNQQQFSYDPNSDLALKQAQNSTLEAVKQASARSNMLYSTGTSQQMLEQAGNLVPEYEKLAYERYQNDQANKYNQLSAIQGLSEQARSEYQSAVENTFAEAAILGKYNGGDTLEGQGMNLQREQQAWEKQYQNKTFEYQKVRDAVSDAQWGKEYKLQLDEFLWNKSDKNPAVKNQILQNKILDIEMPYLSQTRKLEIAKLKQDLDAGKIDLKAAKKQLDQIDAEIGNIKADTQVKKSTVDVDKSTIAVNKTTASKQKADTKLTKAQTETVKLQNAILKKTPSKTAGKSSSYKQSQYNVYKNSIKNMTKKDAKGKITNKSSILKKLASWAKQKVNLQILVDLATEYNISKKQISKAIK